MRFLNKKNKIRFLKHSWVLGLGVIPIVVSACGVSSTFIKNSYFTSGSNGQLSSNLSLSQISQDSLKTNTGMQAYLKTTVNKILYNWLVELGKNNSDYQSKLDSEISSVNTSYNDLVKTYKDKYGSSWELKFQQEVLDPAGGTKDSYINNQLYTFARTTFTTNLFSSLFVSVYDKTTSKVVLNPTVDQILSALKTATSSTNAQATTDSNTYTFKFDRGIDLLSEQYPDEEFAKFQDFIFQKYVEYENPYIVDYTTWKYGTPSGSEGINSVYNTSNTGTDSGSSDSNSGSSSGGGSSTNPSTTTNSAISKVSSSLHDDTSSSDSSSSDSSGDSSSDSSTTSTAGSYAFPYFGYNGSTNETANTIEKFKNFLTDASNNYETNGTTTVASDSSDSLGLKSIDLKYTDDTSTMKLVKNNSIFTDQSVEFAAAASYMYGILGASATTSSESSGSSGSTTATNSTNQITSINDKITHNIDLKNSSVSSRNDSTNPFDIITKNFISQNDLYSGTSSGVDAKATDNSINKLKLSASYLKSIINPSGPLASLLTNTQDYYVIDNFIPGTITTNSTASQDTVSNSKNLSNFMFFRDSTGVQAVSVDGDSLIGKATTVSQKKLIAAMVVLYRYFLGNDTGASFTVDLSSELSSFFSSNVDWLIYQYATQSGLKEIDGTSYTQSMFTNQVEGNDKTLADAIANFLPAYTYYNLSYSAAQKMYDAKKAYNQNYGYSVYKNGLASNFNYSYANSSQSQVIGVNSTYLFTNALLASTATNPYVTNSSGVNVNETTGAKDSTTLYQTVMSAISAVTSSLTVQTAYFDKYTQYVYSNNEYVNAALLSTLSNTSFLSAEIQNPILENYIGNFYTENSADNATPKASSFNEFNLNGTNPFKTANSSDNTNTSKIQTYLQNAMYNFFFLNNFTGETDSLFSYGTTENTKTSAASQDANSSSISLDGIRKYSWDLWNSPNNIDYATKVVNYNTLYKTIATVKYLLGTDLSDFLSYMKDLVGDNQAFVVWENSQNTNISSLANQTTSSGSAPATQDEGTSSSTLTSKSLISYSTPITNINNQSYGPYVGSSANTTSALSYNVISGNLYQTTLNTSYYAATTAPTTNSGKDANSSSNMMGFKGLQTSTNKSLSDDVSTALFTSPGVTSIGTKGVLYQYKSLDNLKNIVSNISSISDLQTLTTNIDTLTNFKFNFTADIDAQLTLASKKSTLLTLFQEKLGTSTSSSTTNDYFTQFSGYVGAKSTTSGSTNTGTTTDVEAYGTGTSKYGIFAYQLNADSFSSLSNLQTALGASTSTTNSYETADEIICNLIVQYAAQTTNQSYIIPNLVSESRVTIYDIRVYNAFSSDGATWVRNWKNITTSSSSSDSSSGSSE